MEVHQILIFADDVNLLGENINAMKKNTGASNEGRLERNAKKRKYLFISHCQNTGQLS
jgi:hypothetical protein